MPVKSRAQARFMRAVAAGKVKNVSPMVGREYLQHTSKAAYKKLPARKKK